MNMGQITVLPAKPIVSDLRIVWIAKNYQLLNRSKETFRNIKGIENAKKIVARRNTDNIKSATWNGIDLKVVFFEKPQQRFA